MIILTATDTIGGNNPNSNYNSLQELFLLCIIPIILLKITLATYVYKSQKMRGAYGLRWAVIVFIFTVIGLIIWIVVGRSKVSSGYPEQLERISTKRALILLGTILLIIGISLAATIIPLITHTPEEYDLWAKDKNRKQGDTFWVAGTIAEKGFFAYRLKGSNISFMCLEDIGSKGDFVIVEIGIDTTGLPIARSTTSPYIVLMPGIILAIIGAIIVFIAFVIGKRKTHPQFTHERSERVISEFTE